MSDMGERVSRLEGEVTYLRERDTALNGSIRRTEGKVDKVQWWLMGVAGGVIASLILLALNLAVERSGGM